MENVMDSGDWIGPGEVVNQEDVDEEKCFHMYEQHMKKISNYSAGGDYLSQDCLDLDANLTNDLSIFLNIGAEAEKRREEQFEKMMNNLEQVSQNNRLLHFDVKRKKVVIDTLNNQISENNELINRLRCEINDSRQKVIETKNMNQQLVALQEQVEFYKVDNATLTKEIEQLNWNYEQFQQEHSNCPTQKEVQNRLNTINHLNKLVNDTKSEIQRSKQEIHCLNENNEQLKIKICQLTNEIKDLCAKQNEKNKSYETVIEQLQCRLTNLSKDLASTQDELRQKVMLHEKMKCLVKNILQANTEKQNKKCDMLQEIISKQANDIKYLEEINSRTTNLLENDCTLNQEIIARQKNEINSITKNIKFSNEEDVESVNLLNEMSQLNAEFHNTPKTDSCSLFKRIIKIRSRVQSRLQREQFKYDRATKELCVFRCKFAKMQKEIETFRASNNNTDFKGEIKLRIQQEQELSRSIMNYEKAAEYSKAKLIPLQKTLKNIDKMREVVRQINSNVF